MSREMEFVDRLPPDVRAVVHDFGAAPVRGLMELGVRGGGRLRQAIMVARLGAREPANRPQRGVESLIDDLLLQHGAPPIGRELLATLRQMNLMVMSLEPHEMAIDASLAALDGRGLVMRRQKHRLRLRAALDAQAKVQAAGQMRGVA